ncbi:MBL fold metallo-hydrolase [Aquimarina algiphila]|uniref:MBL fold metallo-hydrolase n=1 Tax=Aquimarina algiphila TaxID=2047982 RepID=UPI0024918E12|nr:MBL fold metallo-hydrolase [Aquimarina algiphila]
MKKLKIVALLTLVLITTNMNAQKLDLKTFRADENSFHVASVIVSGEKDAVLIDGQFTLANAHRVVAELKDNGKNLTTIYVSHGDPDYYFGLEVITKAYPNAIVYATAPVIEHIKHSYQKKLAVWGPKLGTNGTKNVIMPRELEGNSIDLEGNKLEIKGLGSKSSARTYVWIPSIKAIVGGVNVYYNLHLWIADAETTEDRDNWIEILEGMKKLNPETVIPAHALTDANTKGEATIDYSLNYLKTYQKEEPKAKNSAELIETMQKLYPNAGLGIALQLGAKVSKGEMKW